MRRCAAGVNSQGRRRIFQIFEGNTEFQIAGGGSTISDECEATAGSVRHCPNYELEVGHSFNISLHCILFDDDLESLRYIFVYVYFRLC